MLIVPEKPFRRRRTLKLPAAGPALAVVAVQDVSSGGSDLVFTANFNTTEEFPLSEVGGADPAKWNARYAGERFVGQSVEKVAFNQLYVVMLNTGADAGDDELNYTNAPSDIADALGRELAAFEGFPL